LHGPSGCRLGGYGVTAALVALLVVVSVVLAVTLWLLMRRRATPLNEGSEGLAERYHELIDRVPATIAVWNTETMSVSFVSSHVEQLTGEPAAMWLGAEGMRRFRSRVHPDDLANPDRWRSNNDPQPSQFRFTRTDGRTIWIRESQSSVSGTDMLGILTDVTNEVAATADLAEQRLRYQTLVEQLPVATFLIGVDGIARYVSPQIESILGVSAEQALEQGRDPEARRTWFHPDDYDQGAVAAREMYEGRSRGRTATPPPDGRVPAVCVCA
jgi:PAS domain-containing protein